MKQRKVICFLRVILPSCDTPIEIFIDMNNILLITPVLTSTIGLAPIDDVLRPVDPFINGVHYAVSYWTEKGGRPYQEDRHQELKGKGSDDSSIYGVFDGMFFCASIHSNNRPLGILVFVIQSLFYLIGLQDHSLTVKILCPKNFSKRFFLLIVCILYTTLWRSASSNFLYSFFFSICAHDCALHSTVLHLLNQ
jgi:hypothetical protein